MSDSFLKKRQRKKHLKEFLRHTKHVAHVNDDILSNSTKEKLKEILNEGYGIPVSDTAKTDLFIKEAPERVAKILPKKNFISEYVDIIAVALMVAFGIRALFFQPFKIPTSSMQPTLFGIHYIKDQNTLPNNLPAWLHYAIYSTSKADLTLENSGYFNDLKAQTINHNPIFRHRLLRFIASPWTSFQISDVDGSYKTYELPGSLDKIKEYTGLELNKKYKKGETICKGWLSLGDHLFVDRVSHHFTDLNRGDIIVFNTEGIVDTTGPTPVKLVDRGYFYIKRMVAIAGDTVKIVSNNLYIKPKGENEFRHVSEFSNGLKKIYSKKGGYHGHLNDSEFSSDAAIEVPKDHYFALGDNSANSSDGRTWGFVPRKNIVGRAFFIFWPFSRRWGIADSVEPLDVETDFKGIERGEKFPSMNLQ